MKLIACPWCGETDYDLVGLKRHVQAGECDAFNATENIRSPFDGLLKNDLNKSEKSRTGKSDE